MFKIFGGKPKVFITDERHLENMESQMNPGMGQGEGQDQQIPDIIMSQEELNKQMEEGVKKGESGKPEDGKEGEEGEKGEKGEKGDNDRPGKEGKDGKKKKKFEQYW